jgi:hypothetical protein
MNKPLPKNPPAIRGHRSIGLSYDAYESRSAEPAPPVADDTCIVERVSQILSCVSELEQEQCRLREIVMGPYPQAEGKQVNGCSLQENLNTVYYRLRNVLNEARIVNGRLNS